MITYEEGGVIIPDGLLTQCVPDINLDAVQHRLSQDDFKQFWNRARMHVAINFKYNSHLLKAFILIFLVLFVFGIAGGWTRTWGKIVIIGLFLICVTCGILLFVNHGLIKKKLKSFFEQENRELWNSRGLYWSYVERRIYTSNNRYRTVATIELRVDSSALGYQAPGLFEQSSLQGVNDGQVDGQHPQQNQGYSATNNYSGFPSYS